MARLHAVTFLARDPAAQAAFWAGLLGWDPASPGGGIVPPAGQVGGFRIRFVPTTEPKTLQNTMHLELTSEWADQQQETVDRALALGGRHVDVGQLPEEDHVVIADPEGNELCVIPAGNRFLAGCGFIGDLACDGSYATGRFWSEALGWPLVWDEGEETAIQPPEGGTKLAWGGPPLMPRPPVNRIHLDLTPEDGGTQDQELRRLLELGAGRSDLPPHDEHAIVLVDPDGDEFCLLAR